jgi:predicted nuclease of predicted toxin-antitoxin system
VTIVIDNCLPLSWVEYLRQRGHIARHWRELGQPNAPDSEFWSGTRMISNAAR